MEYLKNENYPFSQTEIGLNVARMIIELIRDNRKIVDLINKAQISQIVERLRENQVTRGLLS